LKGIRSRYAACVRAPYAPQAARAHRRARAAKKDARRGKKGEVELSLTTTSTGQAERSTDSQERYAQHFSQGRVPTMLRRVKRWLLAMLTLPHTQTSPTRSLQRFCRECGTGLRVAPVPPKTALLTRPALRGLGELSGRRASPPAPPSGRVRRPAARRTKGWTKKGEAGKLGAQAINCSSADHEVSKTLRLDSIYRLCRNVQTFQGDPPIPGQLPSPARR
jgi:hypothetical protein